MCAGKSVSHRKCPAIGFKFDISYKSSWTRRYTIGLLLELDDRDILAMIWIHWGMQIKGADKV